MGSEARTSVPLTDEARSEIAALHGQIKAIHATVNAVVAGYLFAHGISGWNWRISEDGLRIEKIKDKPADPQDVKATESPEA